MSGRFDDKIRTVTERATSDFRARLHGVAVDLVLHTGGPRIEHAVALAEDLVASGFNGDATVQVAALRRDAARSDAEPLVRTMLAEHGIDLPLPADGDAEYRLRLMAFGFWDLPMGDFSGPFLHRLPAWDEQDDLERALIILFEDLDGATTPAQKGEVEERMRAVVRDTLGR